jgi:hypothetical protein
MGPNGSRTLNPKVDRQALPDLHSPRSGFSRPQDYAYQPLQQIAQIPGVSSKEGAVLSTRKSIGVITDLTHE